MRGNPNTCLEVWKWVLGKNMPELVSKGVGSGLECQSWLGRTYGIWQPAILEWRDEVCESLQVMNEVHWIMNDKWWVKTENLSMSYTVRSEQASGGSATWERSVLHHFPILCQRQSSAAPLITCYKSKPASLSRMGRIFVLYFFHPFCLANSYSCSWVACCCSISTANHSCSSLAIQAQISCLWSHSVQIFSYVNHQTSMSKFATSLLVFSLTVRISLATSYSRSM